MYFNRAEIKAFRVNSNNEKEERFDMLKFKKKLLGNFWKIVNRVFK